MPQFRRTFSPPPSWSVLEDQSPDKTTCSSSQSTMDELQSPSPSPKKRKSVLPQGRSRLAKKARIVGDLAESPATLSQSPSQSSFEDSSVASLNPTARIPSGKNTKAGSSTNLHHASQNRDDIPPTRVSPRVSRPTLKKLASAFERRSRLPKSVGAPPRSILPLAPPPSLKQKKPTSTPIKTGCSTNLGAASQSRDVIPPTRVSPRVSRPTFKKRASVLERRSCSLKSDGTPPLSILPPTSPPSLKRKKPTGTPIKRLGGNNTPSKNPNLIELTSSDDGRRAQPPQKRVKHTHKRLLSSRVIDLCSESEDVASSPRHTQDEGSVVIVLSTDEESNSEIPPFNSLAFRATDPRKRPPSPSLRDTSLPIEDETVLRASPSPQASINPVSKQGVLVVEDAIVEDSIVEDAIIEENTTLAEKEVDLSRGSLQILYDEALARCAREPQHAKDIADESSSFSSLKCLLPSRIIHYTTQIQSPTLHTPLFFGRIIYRLRAKLKHPKTVKAFSDAISEAFPADASKPKEKQEDILTYPDIVMESPSVDSGPSEAATKTTLVPLLDFQDNALSDTHAAPISRFSPNVLVNNLDVSERPMSKAECPSPSANQENPLSPELIIFQDIPNPDSNQAQEVPTDRRTATPDRANSSAILPNMLYDTPNQSNLHAINYQIETPQDASLSSRENCTHLIPSVLKDANFHVQTLQKRYDASNISGFSLLPVLKSNDPMKIPPASESFPEPTKHATVKSIFSVAVSNNEDTTSKCLSESSMIPPDNAMMRDISPQSTEDISLTSESSEMSVILTKQTATLNLSLLAGPSSEDLSPDSECISQSPAIPNLSPPTSSSRVNTLSPYNSSPSTRSRQLPDSSASLESVDHRLITTPDDSPSPLTPPIKVQKQEPFLCSSSPIDVSFFDIDISELNLQTLMGGNKFDDDDDDISISGMELVYPEEII